MPGERDEIITEHTQIFRVDRGSLEEVLTIARDMEEHAETMAKNIGAFADNMATTFGVVVEKGDEVAEKMGKVAGKTEEAKDSLTGLESGARGVMTALGISLPALSIVGLVGLGAAIYNQTMATRQWAHEVELVSNLSQEWLIEHKEDMNEIARAYHYPLADVEKFGKAIGEAGFTGETALDGLRLSFERVRVTGMPIETVARNIAYEMHELGYTEEEVARRTLQLTDFVGALTEAWKLDAHEARGTAAGILELGMRLQDLTGMPALQMAEMLGIDWEEFTRLQMEEPEQLGVKIMEWVDEATKGVEAKYRPALIEDFLGRLFGIKDPIQVRQMQQMIVEGKIEPVEMPEYTAEEYKERQTLEDKRREGERNLIREWRDFFSKAGMAAGLPPPEPPEFLTMGGRIPPQYLPPPVGAFYGGFESAEGWERIGTYLRDAISNLWQRMRGIEPEPLGTGGGPGTFGMPFAPGAPGAGPIEVSVNLIIEELPQGLTVRTSDGMVLYTRGQGERFISPSP